MPWQVPEGLPVGGSDPIIKEVKDPGTSYLVISEAVADLIKNSTAPATSKVHVIAGDAVFADLTQSEREHMQGVGVLFLHSRFLKYNQVIVI